MNETPAPRTRRDVAIGLTTLILALGATCAVYVLAPRPAIAQAPSASTSAAPPPPPEVRGTDVPAERSEPPKPAEWKDARKVTVLPAICDASMLREYLRVSCEGRIAVAVVAGDTKDTRVAVEGRLGWDEKMETVLRPTAHVVVPLRRGESTLATFRSTAWRGPYMQTYSTDAQLVVAWREGDADPLVRLAFTDATFGE